jgi:hypothetical protein
VTEQVDDLRDNEIRSFRMSDSPLIQYNGQLATRRMIHEAEAMSVQLQALADIAGNPLSASLYLTTRDPQEAARRARVGAIVWDFIAGVANMAEAQAAFSQAGSTVPFSRNEEQVERPVPSWQKITATNAQLQRLANVADKGGVRWVAGNAPLFNAYESYMSARTSNATGRYGFSLLRGGLGRRVSLSGPIHHWQYPMRSYPQEAMSATNLFATDRFSLHMDYHRAMGLPGAPTRGMAFGTEPEIRNMFLFWLYAPRNK